MFDDNGCMETTGLKDGAAAFVAALRAEAGAWDEGELLDALTVVQEVRNVLDAGEAVLLGEVARTESTWLEDGTLGTIKHPLGHRVLDAPDLVASVLGVSTDVATHRMSGTLDLLRTPALVDEMERGALDGFRARVVADELSDASPEAAAMVVEHLVDRATKSGGWVETAGPLRRRAAAVLARIDANVIAEREEAERSRRGLYFRVESTHLDRWDGTFPVEDSKRMQEAIDEKARQIHSSGQAETLAQARADACTQLILGQATVTVHVHTTGSLPSGTNAGSTVRPDAALRGEIAVEAVGAAAIASPGTATTEPEPEPEPAVIELRGFGTTGPTQVSARWLRDAMVRGEVVTATELTCDPTTGALLAGEVPGRASRARSSDVVTTDGGGDIDYRPPEALRRQVRLRDGHCRFPGCSRPARQCDIDHVRPWPLGPTSPPNLMVLCRHHHRVKQSPGWQVRLLPDARVEWTDPVGRVHVTWPVDLTGATLPAAREPSPRPDVLPGSWIGTAGVGPDEMPYDIVDHSPMVEWLERLLAEAAADPSLCDPELAAAWSGKPPPPRSWLLDEPSF